MAHPIHIESFYGPGRGPSLKRLCWGESGIKLLGAEFTPPDYDRREDLHHVRFVRSQAVMITPEEVVNYAGINSYLVQHSAAMMFDLGKSDRLKSFSPLHLGKCSHYQLLFYDELVDVIADGIVLGKGAFPAETRWSDT